jgi:hypothetical protein
VIFLGIILSLMTGAYTNGRIYLSRSSDPELFWWRIGLGAVVAVGAALVAFGFVNPKLPLSQAQQAEYVTRERRKAMLNFAFLALIGAGGSAVAWLQNSWELPGWIALGLLGLAAWPPVLPPCRSRTILRALGTAAIVVAAAMIYRLML